jgi:hypothetical protein
MNAIDSFVGHDKGWGMEKESYAPKRSWWPTALAAVLGFGMTTLYVLDAWRSEEFEHWCKAAVLFAATIVLMTRLGRMEKRSLKQFRRFQRRCPACGYDVRFSRRRCPECGHDLSPVHPGFLNEK